MAFEEIKSLIDEQGKTFEAFKETHEELKKADALTAEKLERIEKSLDAAVEAKAALEARIEAERKEREDLEARINREGLQVNSEAEAKALIELKEFNTTLGAIAADQKRSFTPFEMKDYDEYKAAFNSFLRRNERLLSADEVKTLSAGSDPDGGYFVTPDLSGRIVRKVYETSPMRQVASQQTISTDALEGIEDLDEAGAGYAGEQNTSGNTDTPQVGKWKIQVYWIDTEPKATQQLLDDAAVDVEGWLGGKVADKFARFENAEFVAGATGKIRGFTTYPTAADSGSGVAWGTLGHVVSGKNGAFADSNPADKLFDLVGCLKDAYLGNARWMMRRSLVSTIRKFKNGTGDYIWQPALTLGTPETLLGYPVVRAEDMPALATGSISLAFGDFSAGYQIVDRQGIRVLRDPYTSKPFVKFYTTKRVGGGVVNFEAIKVMKFSAS